jgi:hypothetical protein
MALLRRWRLLLREVVASRRVGWSSRRTRVNPRGRRETEQREKEANWEEEAEESSSRSSKRGRDYGMSSGLV